MNVNIIFGALSPNIETQLSSQGLTFNGNVEALQNDIDAITRLAVRGLLTDSAINAARKKIMKNISKNSKEI